MFQFYFLFLDYHFLTGITNQLAQIENKFDNVMDFFFFYNYAYFHRDSSHSKVTKGRTVHAK